MNLRVVHFIRHARSEANENDWVCGQLDSPLSERGQREAQQAQSHALIQSLVSLPCFVSPLLRTRETASILGFRDFFLEPGLMETNTGEFSKKNFAEMAVAFPQFNHQATDLEARYPGGETTREMVDRAWGTFQKIANGSGHEEIVIVAHAGPINAIVCTMLGIPFDFFPVLLLKNVGVTTVVREAPSKPWCLQRMNVVAAC